MSYKDYVKMENILLFLFDLNIVNRRIL